MKLLYICILLCLFTICSTVSLPSAYGGDENLSPESDARIRHKRQLVWRRRWRWWRGGYGRRWGGYGWRRLGGPIIWG
ncbi:hypothetical protein NECAME_13304 [Necator americanus]|uniref:Uncharacterized protein n=1 Tax=Necator americanus TaxID=51031 RepID=W2SW10_NECAM|nr:hypothetical protein NECAME_13304 [Necator americanus]ETN73934.1 hypothetical protein NECAME_13304 [Necator americanus]